jgi:hypothetical protein
MTPEEFVSMNGLKVADASTPPELIGHGLDPRKPDVTDVAMCGAPFNPPVRDGRENERATCLKCVELGFEAGLIGD